MKLWIRLGCVFLAAALGGGGHAAVVKLRFAGNLGPVGAEATTPFGFEMVYDTARNTSDAVALSGQVVDNQISVVNDFYGYSRSGIVSTNFTFGGMTWTVNDLDEVHITDSLTADFFLDADIATAAPTKAALRLFNSSGLFVGGVYSYGLGGPRLHGLQDAVQIFDDSNELYGPFSVSRESVASEVPEPSSMALLAVALVGLGARLRRRA